INEKDEDKIDEGMIHKTELTRIIKLIKDQFESKLNLLNNEIQETQIFKN
ncbi:22845_t:CDS:2, partial [Racocetra persica]